MPLPFNTPQAERNEPLRMTTAPVPASAAHIFQPVMEALNQAEEIYGVPDVDDYIGLMAAIVEETTVRLENAKYFRKHGDHPPTNCEPKQWSAQYFASGPEGEFFAVTSKFADDLIKAAGYDRDEWTVTDLHVEGVDEP